MVTGDTLLAAGDTSLDGGSVIVAGGTLTVEGPHVFDDLVVLDGASVTHPPTVPGGATGRLDLSLGGEVFVACGGSIDATGRGHLRGPGETVLAEDHFSTATSLDSWQAVDAPGATSAPSSWTWVSDGRVLQTKNIYRSGDSAGTHFVWKGELTTADYRAAVRLHSGDDDKIGLLFRYLDADNHYRFRWQKEGSLQALERVEDGQITILASQSIPYVQSRWYQVEVEARGADLTVWIDGEQVLSATDATLPTGGVALYCDGNVNSSFDEFRVTASPATGEPEAPYAIDRFASSASLGNWQIVDQGTTSAPSNWIWDNGMLRQTTNIHTPGGAILGSFAVWHGELPADYRTRVRIYSGDDDSIGLMVRYQDDANYYRFRWNRQSSTQTIERVEDGQLTTLAQAAVPYVSRWYDVEVEAIGPRLLVWIDGELALSGWDDTHRHGGVALYCSGNVNSYYDDFEVGPPDRTELEGGSHGGRGGAFSGGGSVYGSLFDPYDPGFGGGGAAGGPGGGVVRIAAQGSATVDGLIAADGRSSSGADAGGAGGSIRIDALTLSGGGSISAAGGSATGSQAAGAGGRIALYAGGIDAGVLSRTSAAGGIGDLPASSGGAGTVYLKRDPDPLGELILDNRGVATTQLTELPALLPGTVGTADGTSITDPGASFPNSLFGVDLYLNGDTGTLWPVLANTADILLIDTSQAALTAQPGDDYAGLYRFDRVVVRGGARGIARNPVWSTSPPEVEAGSEWLSGYEPSVEIVEPAEGEWFVAGETLTVTAEVSNLLGVEEGRVLFLDRVGSASLPPYSTSFVVPPQATVGNHPVTFELTDLSGDTTTAMREVELRPSSDAVAPEVAFTSALPLDRDVVEPGTVVSLPFSAVDDALIERYSVRVDGALVVEEISIGQPSLDVPFEWALPADGPVGHEYLLRVEVRDYAGNLGFDERRLRSPAGPLLTGSQNLDASWAGSALTLGTGSFTAVEPLALDSLVLLEGAVLTAPAGSRLVVEVEGEMRVQTGARIDMFGKGYAGGVSGSPSGGAPAWVSVSESDGGGSHGGSGSPWNVPGSAGEVYDSVAWPVLGGGGGALDDDGVGGGHPGGGVVEIRAGALVLAGDIVASSPSTTSNIGRAGGAGGSVLVETGMLSGAGSIHADGGNLWGTTPSHQSGSGGGGRVALHVGSLAGFDPASQVTAYGGTRYYSTQLYGCAAPGTVFVREGAGALGDLRIEASSACATQIADTELPGLGSGSVAALEPAGADAWLSGAAPFRERWLGAWVLLLDSLGADLGTFEVLALDESGRVLLAGASGVVGAATYRGEYRFARVEILGGAGLISLDPTTAGVVELAGAARVSAPIVATDVVVRSGSVVRPAEGSLLRFEASGTLTVEAGAKLDVSAMGYPGGTPASPAGESPAAVAGSEPDAGGSHGGFGVGWTTAGPAGEVYDSVYQPRLSGAGGALDDDAAGDGGGGGGVVDLVVGNLILDGDIDASGYHSDDAGRSGGAGGTVRIVADLLGGTGTIVAMGGRPRSCSTSRDVGAGGGGRVALYTDVLSGFDPITQVLAYGQSNKSCGWTRLTTAGSGTLFVLTAADQFGTLIVDQKVEVSPTLGTTLLPVVGNGLVGVAESDPAVPADLWIEPQDPVYLFSVGLEGVWVRIDGFDFRVVEQSLDRRRLRLEGAAGLVDVGDPFEGVYKFDTVRVLNQAVLEVQDRYEFGNLVVESGGVFVDNSPP